MVSSARVPGDVTSCSPGQLFGATLTPTPTLTTTFTPTKTATATVTRTPTPTITPTATIHPAFDGLPTVEDLDVIPTLQWDEIPAHVALVNAKPNPFGPDAPDVSVAIATKANQYIYNIHCTPGLINCLVDDAFKLPNEGVVLTLRVKNADDTTGVLFFT